MPDQNAIASAAERLRDAAVKKMPCLPVRDLIGETNLIAAYQVQQINSGLRLKSGDRIVGRKIGLTSKSVQAQFGVSKPDFGTLYNSMQVSSGGTISWKDLMQPKVEAEIAFVLAKNISGPVIRMEDLEQAIGFAAASIEIVGSRIKDWNIRITDTIADNASASHFVLGKEQFPVSGKDLLNCKMALYKNGEKVSSGIGSDSMGSPLKAALWLAQTLAEMAIPLKAGDILLTGALGPMAAVEPGDDVKAQIEGLGEARVKFGLE